MFGRDRAARRSDRNAKILQGAGGYIVGSIIDDQELVDRGIDLDNQLWPAVFDIARRAITDLAELRGVSVQEVVGDLVSRALADTE